MKNGKTITVEVPLTDLKTYFPQTTSRAGGISFATRFFGGVDKVRAKLAAALRQALEKLSPCDLEKISVLAKVGPKGKKLPDCKEVIADPSLLTTSIFSRLALPLGLRIDKILVPRFGRGQKKQALAEVLKMNWGVKAAAGGARKLPLKADQLNLILALSAFREIDYAPGGQPRDKKPRSAGAKHMRHRRPGSSSPSISV